MPRFAKITRREQAERILHEATLPEFLLVRLSLRVYRRHDGKGGPELVSDQVLDELLIDLVEEQRWVKSQTEDKARWKELEKHAHVVELPLTIYRYDYEPTGEGTETLMFDFQTPVHAASGGNRSGKTTYALVWLVLRWFYFGVSGGLFRIIGPGLEQAHILMRKLVEGENGKGGILPPQLIRSFPRHIRDSDQAIHMVDGSRIQLMHARGPTGGHLAGVSVLHQVITEATKIQSAQSYLVSVARTVDTRGQTFVEATPIKGHWLEDLVVRQARDDARARQKNPRHATTVRAIELPMRANPWIDMDAVELQRAAAAAADPILAAQEFDGAWVSHKHLIFADVIDQLLVVDGYEGEGQPPDLDAMGYVDVTREASRSVFGRVGVDWIVGQDMNRDPATSVVCKIIRPAGAAKNDPNAWTLYVHDQVRTYGATGYTAANALYQANGGLYVKCGVIGDANMSWHGTGAHTAKDRGYTPAREFEARGFVFKTNKNRRGSPANPSQLDSTALVTSIMRQARMVVNATRAPGVIKALELAEDDGGRVRKIPGKFSDREIAAFTDSIRYLCWPLFRRQVYDATRAKVPDWLVRK